MGDHRASIKVKFEMHGHKAEQDWWINWHDEGEGCDRRIIDWFRAQSGIAMSRYDAAMAEHFAEQHKAETEAAERAELERLKAKYEPSR
jgi:hypothetical protein